MNNRPQILHMLYSDKKTKTSYSMSVDRSSNKNKNNPKPPLNLLKTISINKKITNNWSKFSKNPKNTIENIFPKIKDTLYNTQNKKDCFVKNKTSYYKNEDLEIDDLINEDYNELKLIWKDLGITDEYQEQFNNYINSLNEEKKARIN